MAVQETNLGHFDYISLFTRNASLTSSGLATTSWKWQVPVALNRRRSPSWFISVQSVYLDDSTGSATGRPHFLRLKVPAQNYYSQEDNINDLGGNMIYPIVSMLIRDVPTGHFYSLSQDNIVIQVPSNLQYLEFDIVDAWGNILSITSNDATGESLSIMLKVTYPERTEVMANTTQTYAQSIVGNIRPMNTF